jgi:hypothetical protein
MSRNGFVPASRRQLFFETEASRDSRLPIREFAGDTEVTRSTLAEGNSWGASMQPFFNVVILERVDAVLSV